jgi:hypothetical protein
MKTTEKDLETIVQEYSLNVINITEGTNGYPKNISKAIIGFDNFEDAKHLADKYGMEVRQFHSRDGWQFWEDKGWVSKSMITTSEDYGDNYCEISKMDEETFIADEVSWFLEDTSNLESFEQIEAFLAQKKEIWEAVEAMEDDEIVITHEGRYYDTVQKETMSWSDDTHRYVIGIA